jgi:hypothetical protein
MGTVGFPCEYLCGAAQIIRYNVGVKNNNPPSLEELERMHDECLLPEKPKRQPRSRSGPGPFSRGINVSWTLQDRDGTPTYVRRDRLLSTSQTFDQRCNSELNLDAALASVRIGLEKVFSLNGNRLSVWYFPNGRDVAAQQRVLEVGINPDNSLYVIHCWRNGTRLCKATEDKVRRSLLSWSKKVDEETDVDSPWNGEW